MLLHNIIHNQYNKYCVRKTNKQMINDLHPNLLTNLYIMGGGGGGHSTANFNTSYQTYPKV